MSDAEKPKRRFWRLLLLVVSVALIVAVATNSMWQRNEFAELVVLVLGVAFSTLTALAVFQAQGSKTGAAQIHLITAIMLMFTASTLLLLNMRRWLWTSELAPYGGKFRHPFKLECRGFPWPFQFWAESGFEYDSSGASLRIIGDLIVAMSIMLAVVFFCEWLIRRRGPQAMSDKPKQLFAFVVLVLGVLVFAMLIVNIEVSAHDWPTRATGIRSTGYIAVAGIIACLIFLGRRANEIARRDKEQQRNSENEIRLDGRNDNGS